MATLDWHQTRTNGVTLVELLVASETTTRVRIESELTPVWPPKRQGVPAAGWDGDCFEGTVEGGGRLVVGYASPAEPDGPPARLQTAAATDDDHVDAETLVRALGEAKPPRDLVPVTGDTAHRDDLSDSPESVGGQSSVDSPRQQSTATGEPQPSNQRLTASGEELHSAQSLTATELSDEPTSTELASWFSAVESRLADAERLAAVESPDEATAAVTAVGGIDGVRQLQAQLSADRDRLDRLSQRQRELADRLETVEIPTAVLERVT